MALSFRGFCWLVLGLVPLYLALAAVLPPADDELYYWCWSQRLQLSYYDHPPMTAYMIRAATEVFGENLFAIRLPAVVSSLTVLLCIGWLTRPRALLPFVAFTPLFTLGAVLVTPDTPLLMFWALYVVWLVAMHERLAASEKPTDGARWVLQWALGGLIVGCGLLGKYTTGLALVAGFISFLFAGNWRRWVAGYAVHLAVAFVVASPILLHNLRHDFAPLLYQWRHSMGGAKPGLVPFAEFVGVQLLLFGVLPFTVFAWSPLNRRELVADPRLRVCLCLFALPFAFFLVKATREPLEGNWALPCFVSVWPLAAEWYRRRPSAAWRWLFRSAFVLPAGCVVVLAVHLVHPLGCFAPQEDRITRQEVKLALVKDVADALDRAGERGPVYVKSYQWTAVLRYGRIDARQLPGVTRPSHFTQHPDRPAGDRVIVFADELVPQQYVPGYGPPTILGRFPLVVRGRELETYWLLEYSRSRGPDGVASSASQ